MGGTKISKPISGAVLVLILGVLMIVLVSEGSLVGRAAESTATAIPSPTPTPSLIWENASLDQIHFGEPQVVLTDTLGLCIVGWISDEEVLILRDTQPGGRGNAIEVFNVENGTVRRLAEGRFSGRPVWNPIRQTVVYLQYDEERRQRDLMWQPLGAREGQRLASDVVLPIVLIDGGKGAVAYSVKGRALTGRSVVPGGQERRFPFAQYAMRVPTPYEWIYQTAVSPDGKWQVVYNCEHFLLVDSESGTIKEIDLGDWVTDGSLPRWALEAQWSPDGQMLAVVATVDRLPNQIRFLLLLDPWKNELRAVPLPYGFPIELSWAPNSRLLLVQGEIGTVPPGFGLPGAILIDVRTSEHREVKLYPDGVLGGNIAWSPDGFLLAFLCRHFEEGHLGNIAICLSSVEVEK